MFYFIGGIARSGKTRLTSTLQLTTGCSVFHIDTLMMILRENIPEFGPLTGGSKHRRGLMKPLLISYLRHQRTKPYDTVIEGNILFPEDIADYQEILGETKSKFVFLGYPEIPAAEKFQAIEDYSQDHFCWIMKLPEAERMPIVQNLIARSKELAEECATYKASFVDTSFTYDEQLEKAIKTLLTD